jgi:hypothetical protein
VSAESAGVERARTILDDLIRQRQHMRVAGADESLFEANRLGIVYWQLQLARAAAAGRQQSGAAA